MNDNVGKKLVELLLSDSSKGELAQLLVANGIEITDDELDKISKSSFRNDKFEEIPYELSEDKTAFKISEVEKSIPKEVKETFIRIPSKEEARFLEDIYYQTQDHRLALAGQIRAIKQGADSQSEDDSKNKDNMMFLQWCYNQYKNMEDNIKKALEAFSDSYYISRWAKQNMGIGPVIATVLAANLEIKDDNMHAGNWWSYCGLNDNNRPWLGKEKSRAIVEECIKENGGVLDDIAVYSIAVKTKWKMSWLENRAKNPKKGWKKDDLIKACSFIPYNKSLKVLMFKIGHSFRMCKNKSESLYGRILKEREAYEQQKNLNGDYKDQAAKILATKNIGKNTIAYSYYIKGQLPPAHISQRVERYATKMFISHLFEAAWYNKYGVDCPEPYIIGFDAGGHNDYISPEVDYRSIERDA